MLPELHGLGTNWLGFGMGNIFVLCLIWWLSADFIAGLFHWWEDQYASEDWPIIGPLIAKPNQLHHHQPTAFLRGGYWYRNWTTIAPACTVGALVAILDWRLAVPLFIASQANEIHGWSHQKCNATIRMLQDMELLCSVKQHAVHHVDPFARRYCVISGWLNPVLDFVQFWDVLECLVWAVSGAKPRHWR